MDLGVLSLLVGQQIGKQKKNEYQQKLADEKQKAQEEFERQKEKMLFQAGVNLDLFQEQEKFKATELKNLQIAQALINEPQESLLKKLEAVTDNEIEKNKILALIDAEKQRELILGGAKIDLKLQEYEKMTPLTIERAVGEYKGLTQPTIEREKKLKEQDITLTRADDLFRLTNPEFKKATFDFKIEEIKKVTAAETDAEILKQLAIHSHTELQAIITKVKTDQIKAEGLAQGEAEVVNKIRSLSNPQLQALERLTSAQKILSDANATTMAKIAEVGNKKLNEILLANEKNLVLQGYDLELQNEIKLLSDKEYQALKNKADAESILSKSKAEDQALLNKLNNLPLRNRLLNTRKLEQLQDGDVAIMNEIAKLSNPELQKLGLDKIFQEGIINNLIALDKYQDQKDIDLEFNKQDLAAKKAIEEAESILSSHTFFLPDSEGGKEVTITLPNSQKFTGTAREKATQVINHFRPMILDGSFDQLFANGNDTDKSIVGNFLKSAIYNWTETHQNTGQFQVTAPSVLGIFGFLGESKVAQDIVAKATDEYEQQFPMSFGEANNIPQSNLATTTFETPEGLKSYIAVLEPHQKKAFEDIKNFRLSNNLTNPKLFEVNALRYMDSSILDFYSEITKQIPINQFLTIDKFVGVGKNIRPSNKFINAILTAGQKAGFSSSQQYIDALSIGVSILGNPSQNVEITDAGKLSRLKRFGIIPEDVKAKTDAAMAIEQTVKAIIATFPQAEIDMAANTNPMNKVLLSTAPGVGLRADADTTAIAGSPLNAIALVTEKLPQTIKAVLQETYGFNFNKDGKIQAGSGSEQNFFDGFGYAIGTGNDSTFASYDYNNPAHRAIIQAEFERQEKADFNTRARVAAFVGKKDLNAVNAKDWHLAEQAARKENLSMYNNLLANYNNPQAGRLSKVQAKRELLKFVLAYQYASLLQGGTGGRTISDQDVQNMLSALGVGKITSPTSVLTSSLEVLKQGRFHGEISRAYLSGDASQINAAYIFETDIAPKVQFVYTSRDFQDRITNDVTNSERISSAGGGGQVSVNKFAFGDNNQIVDTNVGTPLDLFNRYKSGESIVVTQEFLNTYKDKYPSLANTSVGDTLTLGEPL